MYGAFIKGVGSYVPTQILSNEDIIKIFGCTNDWIESRTGILVRRIVDEKEATSDLAYFAAVQVLQDAQLMPEDIDMILVATETPDHIFPPVFCQVQNRLGLKR